MKNTILTIALLSVSCSAYSMQQYKRIQNPSEQMKQGWNNKAHNLSHNHGYVFGSQALVEPRTKEETECLAKLYMHTGLLKIDETKREFSTKRPDYI